MSTRYPVRSRLSALGDAPAVEPAVRCADRADRAPWTADEIAAHLRALGLGRGDTVLVQSSLRRVGALDGGAPTLLTALLDVVGERTGTVVVYTASPENSDTSRLALRLTEGMSLDEEAAHKARMPAYDPARTPTSPILGHFSEIVRARKGSRRSGHPQTSFTAVGARAAELTAVHRLESHLGPGSPVQAMFDDPSVRALLIGLPAWCCTAFHYAEYLLPNPPRQVYGCVVDDGDGAGPHWEHFNSIRLVDAHFTSMGPVLERTIEGLRKGKVGDAGCFLFPVRAGVEAALKYLQQQIR